MTTQPSSVRCPHCSGVVACRTDLAGKTVICPHCKHQFKMPGMTPAPTRWYLARNGQAIGPFTTEQFRQMAAAGMFQSTDMILQEGQQQWHLARECDAISPFFTTSGGTTPSTDSQPVLSEPDEEEESEDMTPWSLQLVGCKSCGSAVSRMAPSCPHCGVARPGYESISEAVSRKMRAGKRRQD